MRNIGAAVVTVSGLFAPQVEAASPKDKDVLKECKQVRKSMDGKMRETRVNIGEALFPEIKQKTYTVVRGDSLERIVRDRYGMKITERQELLYWVDKLRKKNGIKGNMIVPGQVLILPDEFEEYDDCNDPKLNHWGCKNGIRGSFSTQTRMGYDSDSVTWTKWSDASKLKCDQQKSDAEFVNCLFESGLGHQPDLKVATCEEMEEMGFNDECAKQKRAHRLAKRNMEDPASCVSAAEVDHRVMKALEKVKVRLDKIKPDTVLGIRDQFLMRIEAEREAALKKDEEKAARRERMRPKTANEKLMNRLKKVKSRR